MARWKRKKRSSKPNAIVSAISPIASVTGMVVKNQNLKYFVTGMVTLPVLGYVFFPSTMDKINDWNVSMSSKLGGYLNFGGGTDSADEMDDSSWDMDWDDEFGVSEEV
tara:strand:+ start:167 stop:490 length:324 start_codon:yes stop_codon:yes gene_type:complete